MGPKNIFRWWGLFVAICLSACGSGNTSPSTASPSTALVAPSCDGFDAGQLLEAAQPCSQIGKRCAFDVNGEPAPVDPDAALKCECLDPYPLTWHCSAREWP